MNISDEENFHWRDRIRVKVKEWIEFGHKITEESALQINEYYGQKYTDLIVRIMYQKWFRWNLELMKM